MYIPKNRIQTNLYVTTKEFVLKGTQEYYYGSYYKTFDGKFFTGKNPNDKPNLELERVIPTEDLIDTPTQSSRIAYQDAPTILDSVDDKGYDEGMVVTYGKLKNINFNDIKAKTIPSQYYPQPTEDDYKLGTFQRYFAYVINTIEYVEVNKDTFTKLQSKDPNWDWTRYNTFSLPWDLAGEEESVYHTNRNITLLTERRLKISGLQAFLRNNYLKFYKG